MLVFFVCYHMSKTITSPTPTSILHIWSPGVVLFSVLVTLASSSVMAISPLCGDLVLEMEKEVNNNLSICNTYQPNPLSKGDLGYP